MLCLPRPTIWAKYSSQAIYKTSETRSSLLAEKRYLNNRLTRRLPNPGLFHRRIKSKHSINTKPPEVARLHHKLGELPPSLHSVIDISGPLHRFTDKKDSWKKPALPSGRSPYTTDNYKYSS